jgi:hypothetical protein
MSSNHRRRGFTRFHVLFRQVTCHYAVAEAALEVAGVGALLLLVTITRGRFRTYEALAFFGVPLSDLSFLLLLVTNAYGRSRGLTSFWLGACSYRGVLGLLAYVTARVDAYSLALRVQALAR